MKIKLTHEEDKLSWERHYRVWNGIKIGRTSFPKKHYVVYKNCPKTYLMTDSTGLIKIGKAVDVWKRYETMKIGNPTLEILAMCDMDVESLLHEKFAYCRVSGEWFDIESDDFRKEFENDEHFYMTDSPSIKKSNCPIIGDDEMTLAKWNAKYGTMIGLFTEIYHRHPNRKKGIEQMKDFSKFIDLMTR